MIPHSSFRINGTLNFVTDYGEEFNIRRRFDKMYVFTIYDRDGFDIIKLDKRIEHLSDLGSLRLECVYLIKNLMQVYDDDMCMINMLQRFLKSITGQ